MVQKLCLHCFRMKGEYCVCPYCGYDEDNPSHSGFELEAGSVLQNRYIVGQVIGHGGFGIIYRAYDTMLGIVVAIKEFFPSLMVNRAEGDPRVSVFAGTKSQDYANMLQRFLEEARNMALFQEEAGFVNVFSYFEENGTGYIVMEFVSQPLLKVTTQHP